MEGVESGQSFIGRQVSHYKIVQRLGAGGMGVVYRATDLKLDRSVALRFLPAHFCYDEHLKERLMQEAKAASRLDHNNIGTIHGIEETPDGQFFIVMAFYDGETLSSKIQRGPLPIAQAIDFAEHACASESPRAIFIDAANIRQLGSAVLKEANGDFSSIEEAAIAKLADYST